MQKRILVVDDEEIFLGQIEHILSSNSYPVVLAKDGAQALSKLLVEHIDLIITDFKMPIMGGIELLKHVKEKYPYIPVIMMTAYGTIDLAVSAMKEGAIDFLIKPFSADHLQFIVKRVFNYQRLIEENNMLRQRIEERYSFSSNIIGKDHKMQQIYETISIVASSDTTVLITGETGTGKDLLARAIHSHSNRKDKPFVKVDCSSLSESLLESELFGHEKGAFTNAYRQRIGRFEYANGGTIFLDEIGELSTPLQVKLLRVLEEKKFERVGGNNTIEVDVRIITATNRDVQDDVRQGIFRRDLYYRLNVIHIEVPPLRERVNDIPLLANHFLKEFTKKMGKESKGISPGALKAMMEYPWPGNVRELENVIEKAVLLEKGSVLESVELPEGEEILNTKNGCVYYHLPFREAKSRVIEEFERGYLLHLLEMSAGNILKASKNAMMDYKTFYEKIRHHNIDPGEFKKPA